MKKVLVLGGSGFIGNRLCEILLERGYLVTAPKSNQLDICNADHYVPFQNTSFDHVIHLAGKTFVPDSWKHPMEFYYTNTIGTGFVLDFCKKTQSPLTYVSGYVYGKPEKLPIGETDIPKPNNPYARSKVLAEQLCEFYANQYAQQITILRPFNVYGPGQRPPFLIPFLLEQIQKNDSTIRVKDLSPKRDFIYLDDLVDAIIRSIEKTSVFNTFNIGSGISHSVEEVIQLVCKAFNAQPKIKEESEIRPNEIQDTIADIEAAKKELEWEPRYDLQEGLGLLAKLNSRHKEINST